MWSNRCKGTKVEARRLNLEPQVRSAYRHCRQNLRALCLQETNQIDCTEQKGQPETRVCSSLFCCPCQCCCLPLPFCTPHCCLTLPLCTGDQVNQVVQSSSLKLVDGVRSQDSRPKSSRSQDSRRKTQDLKISRRWMVDHTCC